MIKIKRNELSLELKNVLEKQYKAKIDRNAAWIKYNENLTKLKAISLMGNQEEIEKIQGEITKWKNEYDRLGLMADSVRETTMEDIRALVQTSPESKAFLLAKEISQEGFKKQTELEEKADGWLENIEIAKQNYLNSIKAMSDGFAELYQLADCVYYAEQCLPKEERLSKRRKPRISAPFPHDLAFDNMEISKIYKRPIV